MNDDFENGEKLDLVERSLYSRSKPTKKNTKQNPFIFKSNKDDQFEDDNQNIVWKDNTENTFDKIVYKASSMARNKNSIIKKIFIGSLVFFILSVAVASFVFLDGINFVSSQKVELFFDLPNSIAAGEETDFDIKIMNNNNTDLESVTLLVEYPTGTRSSSDITKVLERDRVLIPIIKGNSSHTEQLKAIFLGDKDMIFDIKATLEYRIKGSSALFYKDMTQNVSIGSSPVIITPTYPKEVNSNQDLNFDIEIASNSKDSLKDFLLVVEYPFGFVFNSSSIKNSYSNNVWYFENLKPGEKKTVRISGNIVAQDNEERVFRINLGSRDPNNSRVIKAPISSKVETIVVKKPFIGLNFYVSGKDQDFVSSSDGQIGSQIKVSNNFGNHLFNVKAEVSFSGSAFDGLHVSTDDGGFFQSFNNKIIWDKSTISEFSDLPPNSFRELNFRVSPSDYSKIPSGVTPSIIMNLKVTGERVVDGKSELVTSSITRNILFGGTAELYSKIVRSSGSIENEGPIPPKPNVSTEYSVSWTVKNSINQVSNAEVRAKLPNYVSFTNIISPSGESVSFDQNKGEVVWKVGSLLPRVSKTVYFQIRFLPSTSQIDTSPVLINESTFSAIDKVTGAKINIQDGAKTTNFSEDPTFNSGDGKVTP